MSKTVIKLMLFFMIISSNITSSELSENKGEQVNVRAPLYDLCGADVYHRVGVTGNKSGEIRQCCGIRHGSGQQPQTDESEVPQFSNNLHYILDADAYGLLAVTDIPIMSTVFQGTSPTTVI